MTFKEFADWCNLRAADGCWGMLEAMACCTIVTEIRSLPFWKREKRWNEVREDYEKLVTQLNDKRREIYGQ